MIKLKKFKSKVNTIIILYKLINNRNKMGFNSLTEFFSFYIIINPLFNMFFCSWFSKINNEKSISKFIAKKLISKGIGFGALRHISPENRFKFNKIVICSNTKYIKKTPTEYKKLLEDLFTRGYTKLPIKISEDQVLKAQNYFGDCKFFNSQVFAQSDNKEIKEDWREIRISSSNIRNFCFKQIDTIKFLQQNKIVDFEYLKKISDYYCGFNTSLYDLNTFGTIIGEKKSYVMREHRDFDDFKSLTIFIAWTKTSSDDGATLFMPYSHNSSKSNNKMIHLSAKAGEIFAFDSFGLHAGNINVKKPRLTSWIKYGNPINLATIQNGTRTIDIFNKVISK